jgi:hypothetical protein
MPEEIALPELDAEGAQGARFVLGLDPLGDEAAAGLERQAIGCHAPLTPIVDGGHLVKTSDAATRRLSRFPVRSISGGGTMLP